MSLMMRKFQLTQDYAFNKNTLSFTLKLQPILTRGVTEIGNPRKQYKTLYTNCFKLKSDVRNEECRSRRDGSSHTL